MQYMFLFWLCLSAIFIGIEVATTQLTTIWFSFGAIAATFADLFGASEIVQLIIFIGVSVLSLLIIRPYVKKYVHAKAVPTNADMCIGQEGLVIEQIDNIKQTGQVKIKGLVWTARSSNDEIIQQDKIVIVEQIQGVKLIVRLK